jgi:hypothetical protein
VRKGRGGGYQADLKWIEPDLKQIGGQDDGGKAVAKAARRTRRVEIQNVGAFGQAQAFEDAAVGVWQLHHRSIGRRHREIVKIHMAVGLGPQADAP